MVRPQEETSELLAFLQWNPAVGDSPGNADIEQIKLAGSDYHITVLPLLVGLDHRAKQGVDEDLVILLDGLRVYAAIPGYVRIVCQFSVRVAHSIEEPREGRDIPCQSLGEHFLFSLTIREYDPLWSNRQY